ncbi:flavohemoglobin expression-modulating QEGLA motif protein [Galbibacter mesophilus]|uniref:flavohemoglobin expression-modulating QEGLA motif protein n=1 Tax=Galbibacter mesophilus TaxID=379069 RepID=UPI00191CD729|nr:flavohemoglobin expression-modulating QEGLA motif protein [Galbibacter mesophilus]MCM5663335.1 flavohemoglobin expression-modulating QEGLA motif protein [Galbibacter mesophilus]
MNVQDIEKEHANLFAIDKNLDRLIKRVELLSYLNPLNTEKEKQRFFSSKYTEEPVFKYPKKKFNAFKLQRLLFSHKLEKIEDDDIRALYQSIIYYYANMVQCAEAIGEKKKFYYNSLRLYGTPKQKDVDNARFILHIKNENGSKPSEKKYTSTDAKAYFEDFVERYNFPLNIKLSTSIAADAMVSNSTQTLFIKKNARFNDNQLKTLANHEIGVHMVTTFNGLSQPLRIFSNGFPKNVETQEGLAVFSEYMSGALTLDRLKILAYRVIAADSLIKGFSFADTFDLLHGQYKLDRDKAFIITLRIHRGGGFTKDYLYLTGLKKIYEHYKSGASLSPMLTGKVSIEWLDSIQKLQNLGLAGTSTHITDSFSDTKNTTPAIDFILQNLR